MENTLTLNSGLSFKVSRAAVNLSEETKNELATGLKIGVIHTLPLLTSFIAANLLMTSTPDMPTGTLAVAAALQFLAPASLMAYGNKKFHKNTMNILSASLFLAGICNGIILTFVVR